MRRVIAVLTCLQFLAACCAHTEPEPPPVQEPAHKPPSPKPPIGTQLVVERSTFIYSHPTRKSSKIASLYPGRRVVVTGNKEDWCRIYCDACPEGWVEASCLTNPLAIPEEHEDP